MHKAKCNDGPDRPAHQDIPEKEDHAPGGPRAQIAAREDKTRDCVLCPWQHAEGEGPGEAEGPEQVSGNREGKLHVALDRRRIELRTETGTDTWKIDRVRRASKQYGRFWALHFEDAARILALVPMKPSTSLLLWHLAGTLDSVAWTRLIHADIAEAMAIDRTAITRALADLKERGIIMEHGKRAGHWRMSLWLTWRGTAGDYQAQRRTRQSEIDNAEAWHTSRAIANIDSEEATIRYWRFSDEPTATALRRAHEGDTPMDRHEGPPPCAMTKEEWAIFRASRPAGMTTEKWNKRGRLRPLQYSAAEWAALCATGTVAAD